MGAPGAKVMSDGELDLVTRPGAQLCREEAPALADSFQSAQVRPSALTTNL
jgi:hypothetical protein